MLRSLALLTLLAAAPAGAGEAPGPPDPKGKALYDETCATCHMPAGTGVTGQQPALANGNRVVAGDPARLIRLLLEGAAALPTDRKRYPNEMPTFESLTDGEIAAILTYVRGSFGNKARAVTPAQVAAVRGKR
jgi:mono/diheme cytochrome c family protein